MRLMTRAEIVTRTESMTEEMLMTESESTELKHKDGFSNLGSKLKQRKLAYQLSQRVDRVASTSQSWQFHVVGVY
jgi:hypothetical protein